MSDRIPHLCWHKSSFSGTEENCVEAALTEREVRVRDSRSPDRAVLRFDRPAWTEFLAELSPSS
ncbi:DUF397 domain-containing protein [Streptomyces sp. UNOB3_S3]|uniref:DUF397 domain-containing protein n=1 Tax=Streptomyces sp. UNOB3_S3 TaxID=2871682 RepID=UPI001E3CE1D5|nr:DUF397 domain-containing protein [Streptomyces sp. UNOB3_S3]MCC3776918.1 DUF397 domain-containing protein [Streptomyces sp. UNOB3_S3]